MDDSGAACQILGAFRERLQFFEKRTYTYPLYLQITRLAIGTIRHIRASIPRYVGLPKPLAQSSNDFGRIDILKLEFDIYHMAKLAVINYVQPREQRSLTIEGVRPLVEEREHFSRELPIDQE